MYSFMHFRFIVDFMLVTFQSAIPKCVVNIFLIALLNLE